MKTQYYNLLLPFCVGMFMIPGQMAAQEDVIVSEDAVTVTEFECDNTDRYSSSWRDNWFIQFGAGVNQPFVETGIGHDSGMKTIDRHLITPEYNFGVGRWFTPYVGFRMNVLGGVLHWDNPTASRSADGWTRANHVNLDFEIMWDMCNSLAGVDFDRPVSVIPFFGVGGDFMWNMKGKTGGAPVATNIMNSENEPWTRSWTLPVSAGIQFRFRLCRYVDFFAEARAAFYGDNWNGCAYGHAIEANVSALGGFSFNIGGRTFDIYNECMSASEIAYLNGEVNNLRAELFESNMALATALAENVNRPDVVAVTPVADCPDQPLLATVRFKINSSVIEPQEEVNVYNMARYLKDYPDMKVTVVGYADKDTGTSEYNQKLSLNRAQTVAEVLTEKYGISSGRITVRGEGSSEQPYPDENNWNRIVIFVTE